MEIKAWMTYRRKKFSLSYWQKSNECEVDLLLGNEIAIEVKSTTRLNSRDFRGLKEITDEVPVKRRILVSRDPMAMENEGILCLHWSEFCERLWNDNLV